MRASVTKWRTGAKVSKDSTFLINLQKLVFPQNMRTYNRNKIVICATVRQQHMLYQCLFIRYECWIVVFPHEDGNAWSNRSLLRNECTNKLSPQKVILHFTAFMRSSHSREQQHKLIADRHHRSKTLIYAEYRVPHSHSSSSSQV